MADEPKKQLGPRIDKLLGDAFEWFVKYTNDGLYKGRLAEEVERAIQLRMGLYFLINTSELRNVSREHTPVIDQCVSSTERYTNQFIRQPVGHTDQSLTQIGADRSPSRDHAHQHSSSLGSAQPGGFDGVTTAEELLNIGSRSKKKQLGPRVDKPLGDAFEWFVKYTNDGQYKGRLAEEVERAIQLRMGLYFLIHDDELQKISREHAQIIERSVSNTEQYLNQTGLVQSREYRPAREQPSPRWSPPDRRQPTGLGDFPRRASPDISKSERQGTTSADARPGFDDPRQVRYTDLSASDEVETAVRGTSTDDHSILMAEIKDFVEPDEEFEAALDKIGISGADRYVMYLAKLDEEERREFFNEIGREFFDKIDDIEEGQKTGQESEPSDSEKSLNADGDEESEFSFASLGDETDDAGTN